jgi:hypothetical protein
MHTVALVIFDRISPFEMASTLRGFRGGPFGHGAAQLPFRGVRPSKGRCALTQGSGSLRPTGSPNYSMPKLW